MPVYRVSCMQCSHETLHERAVPLDDSGTLPAFCSVECAKAFAYARLIEIYPADKIVELSCGCVVGIAGLGVGSAMTPFPVCAGNGDPFKHLGEICEEAQREMTRRVDARN
jgi:hypothetical protein